MEEQEVFTLNYNLFTSKSHAISSTQSKNNIMKKIKTDVCSTVTCPTPGAVCPSNYRGECEEGVSPEAFGFSLLEMGLIIYFISYKPSSELLLWHTAVGVGLKVTGS